MKHPRLGEDLKGKTAIVTGGAAGIGFAIAAALKQHGVTVAIADLNEDKARAAATELGNGAVGVAIDVRNRASVEAAFTSASQALGGYDILIANAGVSGGTHKRESAVDDRYGGEAMPQARTIFATNVEGVLNTLEPVMGRMAERGRGHIRLMS